MRRNPWKLVFRRRCHLCTPSTSVNGESRLSSSCASVKEFNEIPGPKPLPLIGNIWRYFPIVGEYSFDNLFATYRKMYEQYGYLVREKVIGDRVIVHVFNQQDIITVYENEGRMPQRLSHRALMKYRKDRPSIYKSGGLFPSNGKEWHRFRHLFQGILLKPSTADSYSEVLEDVTDDFVKNIAHLLDDKGEVDLQPHLYKWALECIGQIALNRRLGCLSSEGNQEAEELVKAANDIHHAVYRTENGFPFWKHFPTPSYKKLVSAQDHLARVVKKYMDEAIKEIKEQDIKHSVLARMLSIENADYKDIFTMILDIFLAGIDTTAYTTAFGLYNLARNTDVQDKLREELVHTLPHETSKLTGQNNNIPYLWNVIKETLRINPVAIGQGRVIPTELTLSGYKIPAGTMVILQHQVASRLPEYFPRPNEFLPDRWMEGSDYFRKVVRYVNLPFGSGVRTCVGRRFAEKEMILILGKLIRNYRIEYHYEDIDSYTRLINIPDKPLKLRFLPVN